MREGLALILSSSSFMGVKVDLLLKGYPYIMHSKNILRNIGDVRDGIQNFDRVGCNKNMYTYYINMAFLKTIFCVFSCHVRNSNRPVPKHPDFKGDKKLLYCAAAAPKVRLGPTASHRPLLAPFATQFYWKQHRHSFPLSPSHTHVFKG